VSKPDKHVTDQGEQRVRVGCRDFTLAEGRAYWAAKPDRREVLAALDYAETIAESRGWKDKQRKAALLAEHPRGTESYKLSIWSASD